ncbi:hypothetical protein PybrP1_002523 [[Pythium] brassicae (nom. inval.)]|nr:hypothetical protein PybrP1_002523 [[Pythium] brassicae (nom. inval.)]
MKSPRSVRSASSRPRSQRHSRSGVPWTSSSSSASSGAWRRPRCPPGERTAAPEAINIRVQNVSVTHMEELNDWLRAYLLFRSPSSTAPALTYTTTSDAKRSEKPKTVTETIFCFLGVVWRDRLATPGACCCAPCATGATTVAAVPLPSFFHGVLGERQQDRLKPESQNVHDARDEEARAVAVDVDDVATDNRAARPREDRDALERVPARADVLRHVVHEDGAAQGLRAAHHAAAQEEEQHLQRQRLRERHREETEHGEAAREDDERHAAERLGQALREIREHEHDDGLADEEQADPVLLHEEEREEVDRHAGAVADDKVREEEDPRYVARAKAQEVHVLPRQVPFLVLGLCRHLQLLVLKLGRHKQRRVLSQCHGLEVLFVILVVVVLDVEVVASDRRRAQRLLDLLLAVLLLRADVLEREVVVEAQQEQPELCDAPLVAVVQEEQDADRRAEHHRQVAHVVLDHERVRALAVRDGVGKERLHSGALQCREQAPEPERDVEHAHGARLDGVEREHGAEQPDSGRDFQDRVAADVVRAVAGRKGEHEL